MSSSTNDDRRRYLILGSVFIEVVSPLLREKIKIVYQQQFGSFEAFLNSQPVKHLLFHLRHRNVWCCTDKQRCTNGKLPLYHSQWNLLYAENPGQATHTCHCKFTARAVQINDLDLTLLSLILLNCCTVSPSAAFAIRKLRQFKNELLSHNTTGEIKQTEYDSNWGDITMFVLQLDPSKQDDLIRLENRPLDNLLCTKYFTFLLNIHEIIDKMGITIQQVHAMLERSNDMMSRNNVLVHKNNTLTEEINSLLRTNNKLTEENHTVIMQIVTCLRHVSNTQTFETDHEILTPEGLPVINVACDNCHHKDHRASGNRGGTLCPFVKCPGFHYCGLEGKHKEHRQEVLESEKEVQTMEKRVKSLNAEIESIKSFLKYNNTTFITAVRPKLLAANAATSEYKGKDGTQRLNRDLRLIKIATGGKVPSVCSRDDLQRLIMKGKNKVSSVCDPFDDGNADINSTINTNMDCVNYNNKGFMSAQIQTMSCFGNPYNYFYPMMYSPPPQTATAAPFGMYGMYPYQSNVPYGPQYSCDYRKSPCETAPNPNPPLPVEEPQENLKPPLPPQLD